MTLNTDRYNPKNISNKINKTLYFPLTDNRKDMNKLRISNIGSYSITKPKDAEWITEKILENVKSPKKLIITDATAAIGGNSINFGKYFKRVNSIEMNPVHYEMLKNNIGVYGLKNIDFYLGDSTKLLKEIKQDIVFIDAPWGGPEYKKFKTIRLYLSEIPITDIINSLIKEKTKYIFLKVPKNFDYTYFFKYTVSNHNVFKIYVAKTFHLIFINNL